MSERLSNLMIVVGLVLMFIGLAIQSVGNWERTRREAFIAGCTMENVPRKKCLELYQQYREES